MTTASRFKFRHWDPDRKEMRYVLLIDPDPKAEPCRGYIFDGLTMQSTGLLDKNGREVFENDIIASTGYNSIGCFAYSIGVVKYGIGTFDSGIYLYPGWYVESADGTKIDHSGETLADSEMFKVIGNIHENPGMLK